MRLQRSESGFIQMRLVRDTATQTYSTKQRHTTAKSDVGVCGAYADDITARLEAWDALQDSNTADTDRVGRSRVLLHGDKTAPAVQHSAQLCGGMAPEPEPEPAGYGLEMMPLVGARGARGATGRTTVAGEEEDDDVGGEEGCLLSESPPESLPPFRGSTKTPVRSV